MPHDSSCSGAPPISQDQRGRRSDLFGSGSRNGLPLRDAETGRDEHEAKRAYKPLAAHSSGTMLRTSVLPMKTPRLLRLILAAALAAATAFAADATGTWRWQLTMPNGDIETTLKLALKDGKLGGTYSNSFGETAIKEAVLKDDVLTFAVDREIGGNKFTLKFRGKVEGDAIKGELEAPGFDGGGTRKTEWNAKRVKENTEPKK